MYLTKNPTQNVTNVRKIIHKGASFNKVRINNLSTDVVDDPLHLPGCFLTLGGLHIGGLPPTRRGVAAASLVDAERVFGSKTVFGEEETRGATDGVHRHRLGVEREAARGQR